MTAVPKERHYYIDTLRVIGTILVFIFHVSQPFNPNQNWHITNPERLPAIGYFIAFMALWFMPFFMLIGGSSMKWALEKRTGWFFFKERVVRILVPFILGVLLLAPPQIYVERLQQQQLTGSFWNFYPHFFSGLYPTGNFSWQHLWFLAYLFTYSLILFPFFLYCRTVNGKKLLHSLAHVASKRGGLLVFAVPLIFFQCLLQGRFPQTNNFYSDWLWHSQLCSVFIFGFILQTDPRFIAAIRRDLALFCSIAIPMTFLLFFLRSLSLDASHPFFWSLYIAKCVTLRLATWSWIVVVLSIGYRYLNRTSPLLSYANYASYSFYILHQTMIVIVAFFVVQDHLSPWTKWALILVVSFAMTMLGFELCKRNKITRWVIGLRG